MLDRSRLNAYLGKDIGKICPLGYASPHDNHCAHFVSHALGYSFGYTCRMMKSGLGQAGSLRVQEVFARCPSAGKWDEKPVVLMRCLVFITAASDVHLSTRQMENVGKKHVGILTDGLIWHYSNSRHQVVYQTPEQFKHHFPAPHNSMFYGQIPWAVSL
jgi:hypothetical protein